MNQFEHPDLAAQQLEKYSGASLDDLYQMIGLRLSDVQASTSNTAFAELGKFETTLRTDPQTLAASDDLKEFGTAWAELGEFEAMLRSDPQILPASDDLKEFGRRVVARLHQTTYEVVCAENRAEDRQTLFGYLNMGTLNKVAAVGLLSSLMVTSLGMSPSIAGLVAWAIVNIVLEAGRSVTCEMWGELLSE